MAWIVFAIGTAVFSSIKDVISKQGLKNVDEYLVTWASRFFALPLLLPLLFFIEIPPIGDQFLLVLFVILFLQIIANILYFRSLKLADLSVTVPLISLTPIFLLITSPVIVGEIPRWVDLVGIFFIVGGSYCLNWNQQKQGYLAPLQALIVEQGSRLMLIVAALWSVMSTLSKVGVENSSPAFWTIVNTTCLATALLPLMLSKSPSSLAQIRPNLKYLLPLGIAQGLMVLCFMQALELTSVTQVVSVKRLSILTTIILGHSIFEEKGIKQRIVGATFMIFGVSLMTIF